MKKYIVRPSAIVSKNDGDIHYITAAQLIKLHRVSPSECIIIPKGEDWPLGYGPLKTAKQRLAAGLQLLTPAFHGNYGT